MLNWAKVGIGVATLSVALGLVPALAASASVKAVKASDGLRANQLCTVYKADVKAASSKVSAAIGRAIASGNWKTAQHALLGAFASEAGAEKSLVSALGSAPGNVQSAAGVALKFDSTLKNIISSSTSMTQYESKVTTASENPKLLAAEKTLDTYTQKVCPGLITTPTT
jgi:hypothetical protein